MFGRVDVTKDEGADPEWGKFGIWLMITSSEHRDFLRSLLVLHSPAFIFVPATFCSRTRNHPHLCKALSVSVWQASRVAALPYLRSPVECLAMTPTLCWGASSCKPHR